MGITYRYSEIHRRIIDLLGISIRQVRSIDRWAYIDSEVELPFTARVSPDDELLFSARVYLEDSPSYRWVFKASISGGGLLILDGKIHQGLDPAHSIAFLPSGHHEIKIRATSRALFGENPWVFSFNYSLASLVNWRGISLGLGMLEVLRASRVLDGPVRGELLELLSRSLERVDLVPSVAQVTAVEAIFEGLGEPLASRWDRRYVASVYGFKVVRGEAKDLEPPEAGESDRAIEEAYRAFESGLEELLKKYPKEGEIVALGHCHIDAAWLWPYSETRRKVLRSFSNILRLFSDGYSFSYAQSSAQYYRWAEEYPEIFRAIEEAVRKGLWIPVGGMWIESDTNLVWGESLARHFLYGQLYFLERFGRIARIGWLPDSFGFSAQLPQLMRLSGIEVFVTHKIMWNDTNKFPHHLFNWEGLDGTSIPVHVIITTYNGSLTSEEIKRVWEEYSGKGLAPAIHAFGVGDGGGGPGLLMLERIYWLNKMPKLPRVEHEVREDWYVGMVSEASRKAPTWRGELYVEIHRGTYTTNPRIKELVYRAEECLRTAEIWSSIAYSKGLKQYPGEELRRAWETLLRAEFHDVLPGSSNYEAYREAYSELEDAINICKSISEEAMRALAGGGSGAGQLTIFNPLPWARRAVVELPRGSYRYLGGAALAQQDLGDRVLAEIEVPPTGYVALEALGREVLKGSGVTAEYGERGIMISNDLLRIWIGRDGVLEIEDLSHGFRVHHRLRAHIDKPGDWDAWDVERSSIEDPGIALEPSGPPEILYSGGLKSCARVPYRFRGSEVVQVVCISKDSRVVEVSSKVRWTSRGYLLKAWFRPSFQFDDIYYEIPFGVIRRSSKPKDSWDHAKFEVPALRWADVSDGSKGFAVISMSRHGYSPRGEELGLTLAKAPLFPDPYSGVEEFEVKYYVYTHAGDYRAGGVPRVAYELWSPLRVVAIGARAPRESFLSLEGGDVLLESVKKAERGGELVLRLCEIGGRSSRARINLWGAFEVLESDILERPLSGLKHRGSSIEVQLRPFEIKTLILRQG